MGEFWHGPPSRIDASPIPANVADVYGQKYVQTETFTAGDRQAGWTSQGDAVYCAGVNRFVFHSYAHQPFDTPGAGITMGKWGFHFNRHNTLWDFYPGWIAYLGRAQYLLQQGRGVADVVYLMSEDQPSHLTFNPPPLPGRRANGIDVGLFLDGLAWNDGELTLPSGMRYRLLVVGETARMSVASLRKIRSLAASGAEVLLGRRPVHPFGLAGHAEGDVAFKRLVVELWDGFSATASSRRFGKGRLWHGVAPEKVLEALNVPFDFEAVGADEIGFTHRRLADRDIYFVANHSSSSEVRRFTGVFRAAGTPEFWDACDGSIQAVEEFAAKDGLTRIGRSSHGGSRSYGCSISRPIGTCAFRTGAARLQGTCRFRRSSSSTRVRTWVSVTSPARRLT